MSYDFPTQADLFRVGRDEILAKNSQITRDVIEREGSDANVFVACAAAIGDECMGQLARVQKGLYTGTARGSQLDTLIFDRYGVARKQAAPAIGSARFATTAVTSASFSIPEGTRVGTNDGRIFITEVAAVFPSGSTGPIDVAIRSVLAGLDQQVGAGTITLILDTIAGAPADLTVTNPLATAGADDEEKDDDYVARAQRTFESARKGTLAAIEAAAEAYSGVKRATAFETLDQWGRPLKSLQLIISDAFVEGLVDVSPTPVTYQTQSQVLASSVFAALDDVRAGGIYVDVRVAVVALLNVQLGLSFESGVNYDSVALKARARLVSYINGLAPGAYFVPSDAVDELRNVAGLVITGNEILSPTGSVLPDPLEVLRTYLGAVQATSVQPDQALQGSSNPDTVGT